MNSAPHTPTKFLYFLEKCMQVFSVFSPRRKITFKIIPSFSAGEIYLSLTCSISISLSVPKLELPIIICNWKFANGKGFVMLNL